MKNEYNVEKNKLEIANTNFISKVSSQIKKLEELINLSESTNFILFNRMINNKNVQFNNIFDTLSYFANQFHQHSQPINIFESFFIPNEFHDLKEVILYPDERQNKIQNIGIKSKTIETLFTNKYFSLSKLIEYLVNKFNQITFEVYSSSKSFYDILDSISEIKSKSNQLNNKLLISIVFDEKEIINIKKYKELVNSISINIPVEKINANDFEGFTSLSEVKISNSVTLLHCGCFSDCSSLKEIIFDSNNSFDQHKSNLSIESFAFKGCNSLKSIEIPYTVKSIKNSCFLDCSSLEKVIITFSVTKICDHAFEGCSSLTCINSIIHNKDFSKNYSTDISIDNGIWITQVNEIGKYAFKDCTSISSIFISSSLKLLDSFCFYGCSSLTRIRIPESITEIRDHVFENCISLENIEIPDSIILIGDRCFSNCSKLKSITIPSSIKSIGSCAFYNCSSLKYIFIASSVDEIGENAFAGCISLDFIATSKSLDSFQLNTIPNTIIFVCENESTSLLFFGNMLYEGKHGHADKLKAMEYFNLAAAKGNSDAQKRVKEILKDKKL